jgi:hypothetical protein
VIRFSAPSTIPSFVKIPTQEPAFEIASIAYLHQNRITASQTVGKPLETVFMIKLLTRPDEVVPRVKTAEMV